MSDDWRVDIGIFRFTASYNYAFCGVAFYVGYFDDENTFELVLQIGRLELGFGISLE